MNQLKDLALTLLRPAPFAAITLAALALSPGCASTALSTEPVKIHIQDDAPKIAEARAIALEAQNAKSPADAIELYHQAIGAYHDLAPVWNNLGVLLMGQQRYLDAAEAFTTASELTPTDARPLYNLGLTWEQAGYLRDALRYYSKALGRNPRYQPALRGAIRAERTLGRATDETLRRLRIALGQEQDKRWRTWFEFQRPLVEAQLYADHSTNADHPTNADHHSQTAPPRAPGH